MELRRIRHKGTQPLRKRTKPENRRGAFTLTELLITLILITMFASVAVPRSASFLALQRAESAVQRIKMDLALAQRQAKLTSSPRRVEFDLIRNSYTLPGIVDPDHPNRPYVVKLSDPPYEARIVSANFGGPADAIFDGYGAPAAGGSIVIEVGHNQKTIQLGGPAVSVPNPPNLTITQPPQPIVTSGTGL